MKSRLPRLQEVLAIPERSWVRGKTVCTLTPTTATVEALVKLLDAGMTGLRIQMTLFDQKAQLEVLRKVREAKNLRPHLSCAILMEVRGGELVLGSLKHHQAVTLVSGQEVQLINSVGVEGDSSTLVCAHEALPRLLKVGDYAYFDEGAVICQVTETTGNGGVLQVVEGGEIFERRSVTLPGANLNAPPLTDRDEEDINTVVLKQNVDFLVLTQVRGAAAVEQVRDLLASKGSSVRLLVKVQNQEMLEELGEALQACDGLLLSPFELGLDVPTAAYSMVQDAILAQANALGKPILMLGDNTAQWLAQERLQTSALSTALILGVDGLVLPKTTSLDVQLQAMEQWRALCRGLETSAHFQAHARYARTVAHRSQVAAETSCETAVQAAEEADARVIVVLPNPDFSLSTLHRFKSLVPVLLVHLQDQPLVNLAAGCYAIKVQNDSETQSLREALDKAKEWGMATEGDRALVLGSAGLQGSLGALRVISVP